MILIDNNCVREFIELLKITFDLSQVLFEVFKETMESVNQLWCIIRPTSALRIENPDLLSSIDSTALV